MCIAHEFAVELSEEDVRKEAHGLSEQKAKNDGNREWEVMLEWHNETCEEGQCPEAVTHVAPESALPSHFVNCWIKLLVYLASDHPGHSVKCDPATGNELAVQAEICVDWVYLKAGNHAEVAWKKQSLDDECNWNENWINLTLLEVLPVRLNYVSPRGVDQSLDEEYRVEAHLDDNGAYVEALTLWQE